MYFVKMKVLQIDTKVIGTAILYVIIRVLTKNYLNQQDHIG